FHILCNSYLLNNKKISREALELFLAEYGLLPKKDEQIFKLSCGMRQKLAFLLTNIHETEFLLLDEPFTVSDPGNLQMMKTRINQTEKSGCHNCLINLYFVLAADVCDRIAFIDRVEI